MSSILVYILNRILLQTFKIILSNIKRLSRMPTKDISGLAVYLIKQAKENLF